MSAALYRLRGQRDDAIANHVSRVQITLDDLKALLAEYDTQNMHLRRARALLDGEPNNEEDE